METQRNYIVNLAEQTCTCSIWQLSGFPCGHALSILLKLKKDPQRYVKPFFTIASYKKIYEQALIPLDLSNVNGDAIHSPPSTIVSDNEEPQSEEEPQSQEDDPLEVLPPSTRRAPGRPKKRRIRGKHDEVRPKRVFTCTRCKETGHSKRTCREGINLNTPA
jgi:zinc finger SWIM domain-containing protein 3